MEFPVVSLVGNVWLQDPVDPGGGAPVEGIVVGHMDGNVLDDDSDEGHVGLLFPTDPDIFSREFDELGDHVEGGKAKPGVHLGDVFGQCLLGGTVLEDAGGVENEPERHVEGCLNWRGGEDRE